MPTPVTVDRSANRHVSIRCGRTAVANPTTRS